MRDLNIPRPIDKVNWGNPPAVRRDDITERTIRSTYERADLAHKARLRMYPTINIDFKDIYAGSVPMTMGTQELESRLNTLGFRNNVVSYVEVTDEYGPEDGSYAKQIIEPLTWWDRVKDQYHTTIFFDEEMSRIHICCHREKSSWIQPVRHLAISEGDGMVGAREFRDFWYDEFGEELERDFDFNPSKPDR